MSEIEHDQSKNMMIGYTFIYVLPTNVLNVVQLHELKL